MSNQVSDRAASERDAVDLDGPWLDWSPAVMVRGSRVPLRHPMLVRDADNPIDRAKRWPGILAWLRRLIAGPARNTERDILRHAALAVTEPTWHPLVRELTAAECCVVLAANEGAQQAWMAEMAEEAQRQASARMRTRQGAAKASSTRGDGRAKRAGSAVIKVGRVREVRDGGGRPGA